LEHCPGVVVGVSLIGFYVGAGYMGYLSFKNFKAISADEEDPILKGKRRFFQIAMFTILSTLAIVSCLICCFWSELVLATKIIGVRQNKTFSYFRLPQSSFLTQRESS